MKKKNMILSIFCCKGNAAQCFWNSKNGEDGKRCSVPYSDNSDACVSYLAYDSNNILYGACDTSSARNIDSVQNSMLVEGLGNRKQNV